MSIVDVIELRHESMLLSTDEREEVETPTEYAFVVLAEMDLSVHGFSNLTIAGAKQLYTLNNIFEVIIKFFFFSELLYHAENPPYIKKTIIQVGKE